MKAVVPIIREMAANDPSLSKKFLAKVHKYKSELLGELTKAFVWEKMWDNFQQQFGSMLGIFSVTEDPTNPQMWSHYASSHRGVVVEFDDADPWFHQKVTAQDDLRHLIQVTYVQNPPPRTWRQLTGADVLYTKSAGWAYEREWRIIRPIKDAAEVNPRIFCFDVPPAAVRTVIFGCRTNPAVEMAVRDAITSNPLLERVRFKRAKLGSGGKIEIVDAA